MNRSLAYWRKGDLDRAINDIDAAIRLKPRLPFYYEVRTAVRLGRQDYDGAIADFDTEIRLNPVDRAARFETLGEGGNLLRATSSTGGGNSMKCSWTARRWRVTAKRLARSTSGQAGSSLAKTFAKTSTGRTLSPRPRSPPRPIGRRPRSRRTFACARNMAKGRTKASRGLLKKCGPTRSSSSTTPATARRRGRIGIEAAQGKLSRRRNSFGGCSRRSPTRRRGRGRSTSASICLGRRSTTFA